jgi:hypothetical protein
MKTEIIIIRYDEYCQGMFNNVNKRLSRSQAGYFKFTFMPIDKAANAQL